MNDKIVWYSTFYNSIEAHIVRTKLEDSGFHCFLTDENISTINPLYNQAVGGIKLMVFERDTADIDLLLSEDDVLKIDDAKPSNDTDVIKTCEKCGSTNVGFGQATKGRYSWWVTIVSLMFAVYPFKVNKCFHCYNCGHEFH